MFLFSVHWTILPETYLCMCRPFPEPIWLPSNSPLNNPSYPYYNKLRDPQIRKIIALTGWCHDCRHYSYFEMIWSGVCGDKNYLSTIPETNIAPTSRSSGKEKRSLQPPSSMRYGISNFITFVSGTAPASLQLVHSSIGTSQTLIKCSLDNFATASWCSGVVVPSEATGIHIVRTVMSMIKITHDNL